MHSNNKLVDAHGGSALWLLCLLFLNSQLWTVISNILSRTILPISLVTTTLSAFPAVSGTAEDAGGGESAPAESRLQIEGLCVGGSLGGLGGCDARCAMDSGKGSISDSHFHSPAMLQIWWREALCRRALISPGILQPLRSLHRMLR